MYLFDIGLHKVSLGTLILALGLLVDDAIIAVETMAVKLEQGFDRLRAAAFAYTSTAFPMLTGTLVTVAGFPADRAGEIRTGEYTRSIFEVSAIALLLSWLAAVVVIPLLGFISCRSIRPGAPSSTRTRPSMRLTSTTSTTHRSIARLRGWIAWCVDRRVLVLLVTFGLFVLRLRHSRWLPQQFFPSSDRPELLVDLRLPEGASFAATLREAPALRSRRWRTVRRSTHFVDFVGTGAPRFYLPLDQQLAAPNFAQFVITAKSVKDREQSCTRLGRILRAEYSAVRTRITRLENGPPVGFPVQFRVSGPEIATVRRSAEQVAAVMRADPDTTNVQFDWDEPAERSVHFEVDQTKARELNISSQDIANYLQMSLTGYTVTQYRERDKLIERGPARAEARPRRSVADRAAGACPTPSGTAVPLAALGRFTYGLEYGVVWERDRQPTITVQSDVQHNAQGIDVTNAHRQGARRAARSSCRSDIASRSAARSRRTPRHRRRSTRRCRCWSSPC